MFTLESYSNPVWADAAQTVINADVVFKEIGAAHPFSASKNDIEAHGVAVFDAIVAQAATIPIGAYVGPSLIDVKTAQASLLRAACAAAIVAGYQSSALGSPYTYPSSQTDQINMLGSVSASMLPNLPAGWTTVFMCEDAGGSWALREHTAAQIQQAGFDGKAWVTTNQTKLANLLSQIYTSTTIAAVQSVTW